MAVEDAAGTTRAVYSGREGENGLEGGLCSVCWESAADATIVHGETGHVCCCLPCAKQLKANGARCPICRAPIEAVIKAYRSTA